MRMGFRFCRFLAVGYLAIGYSAVSSVVCNQGTPMNMPTSRGISNSATRRTPFAKSNYQTSSQKLIAE